MQQANLFKLYYKFDHFANKIMYSTNRLILCNHHLITKCVLSSASAQSSSMLLIKNFQQIFPNTLKWYVFSTDCHQTRVEFFRNNTVSSKTIYIIFFCRELKK